MTKYRKKPRVVSKPESFGNYLNRMYNTGYERIRGAMVLILALLFRRRE